MLDVDDHAQAIRMLLYIRHAWHLAEELPLPQLHPAPETGSSAMPRETDPKLWEQRWRQTWLDAWGAQTQGSYRAPGTAQILAATEHLSENDFWTAKYSTAGLNWAAFQRWEQMFDPAFGLGLDPVLRSPAVHPVLLAAWERGLRKLTVVPWAGFCVYRLSDSHLVTSFGTAASRPLLTRALAEWLRTPLE